MKSKSELMYDAIHVEQEIIKEAVGSQDQTAAAYGGFNNIIFRKDSKIEVHPMTISTQRIETLENCLLLVFSGFQRFAKDIEEKKIKKIAQNIDALITMESYVNQAIDILSSDKDMREFGALLNDTWMKKKTLSEQVSTDDIDKMYQKGIKNGAIGGKLLGAGGGGFMLFFVMPEKREQLIKSMRGHVIVPIKFDHSGSQVIYYMPEERF